MSFIIARGNSDGVIVGYSTGMLPSKIDSKEHFDLINDWMQQMNKDIRNFSFDKL